MNLVQHGSVAATYVAEQFEAKDLQAPFKVVLHDAVKMTVDTSTNEVLSYSIPDLEGLIGAVVVSRVLHPRNLAGPEIRFVRKAVGLTQKEFAQKIEMTVEHLSRCENGVHVLPASSEKLLRIFSFKMALKLPQMKSSEVKERLEEALDKVFDVVKPLVSLVPSEPLELHFHRTRLTNIDAEFVDHESGSWRSDGAEAA